MNHLNSPAQATQQSSQLGEETASVRNARRRTQEGTTTAFPLLSTAWQQTEGKERQAGLSQFRSIAENRGQRKPEWLLCQCIHGGRKALRQRFFIGLLQFVIIKTGCGRKDLQSHSCGSEVAGVGSNLCWSGDWIERN